MKCNFVYRYLSASFRCLGYQVGLHPFWFGIIPLILTVMLSVGFKSITLVTDVEYLVCPTNGRAWKERAAVESLFPPNLNDYDFLRDTRLRKSGNVICVSKDRGTVLKESIMDDIISLDSTIRNISIVWKNKTFRYSDMCCKSSGECVRNGVLSFRGKTEDIRNGLLKIRPFLNESYLAYSATDYAANLGGISFDENGYLKEVKAVRLFYILDDSTPEKTEKAIMWEKEFIEVVSRMQYINTDVYRFTRSSFDYESNRLTEMSIPLLLISIPAIVIFAVVSCMTTDWVTSKPWIGVAGCLNSGLAVAAAFGLLLWFNKDYVDLNIAIPFLILGIGLDDSFVLLAAWRRTNPEEDVPKRLSETYSEGAISITITSLTNLTSFAVGMTSSYRLVHIFSSYMVTSILFDFIFQITFFGSCMALSGYRENRGLHAAFCIFVEPDIKSRNYVYRLLTYGIPLKINKYSEEANSGNLFMLFYRDVLGKFLCCKWSKFGIILTFITYLFGAIYCLRYMKEGIKYQDVFPYHSFGLEYSKAHYHYFTQYPQRIQVVINNTLDFSDTEVQNKVMKFVQKFEDISLVERGIFTEFWLKYYLKFLQNDTYWFALSSFDTSNPDDFIFVLRNVFLKLPWARHLSKDIIFNEDGNITATRFLIESKNVKDANLEKILLENLWETIDSSDFDSHVHQFWFIIFNQHLDIKSTTIQTLCIAAVLVIIMFIFFITNVSCAICVSVAIISIEIGAIGYMSAWDVRIDTISMIALIMSTGFCVDYAAHISYAYVKCKSDDSNIKIMSALYAAGHPIVQGCVSTIVGVLVFYFGSCNVFIVFLKIVFMVMVFSLFHGLFVLPVLLSIWDIVYKCSVKNSFEKEKNDQEEHEISVIDGKIVEFNEFTND